MTIINFKHLLAIGAVIGALLGPTPHANAGIRPALFQSEQQAKQHCPRTDTVVWLNLSRPGFIISRDSAGMATMGAGAYVCE